MDIIHIMHIMFHIFMSCLQKCHYKDISFSKINRILEKKRIS